MSQWGRLLSKRTNLAFLNEINAIWFPYRNSGKTRGTCVALMLRPSLGRPWGRGREAVARVAESIGCKDFAGELSPTDKPLRVRALRTSEAPIAMVGDGVNDAPALGAADVGIAFGPAADLAKETADVTILREDLLEIPRLLDLARKTFRVVRQNLAWAFAYNVVAVVIAALGLLRPVFAAAAMVLSSVCVVSNSMRLGRLGNDQ